jgi:hypothetical protein
VASATLRTTRQVQGSSIEFLSGNELHENLHVGPRSYGIVLEARMEIEACKLVMDAAIQHGSQTRKKPRQAFSRLLPGRHNAWM